MGFMNKLISKVKRKCFRYLGIQSLNVLIENDNNGKSGARMSLYILIDCEKAGLIDYLRQSGIYVTDITTSPEELNSTLMFSDEAVRLVVIDTGRGAFRKAVSQDNNDLSELIEMCSTDDRRTLIEYTDLSIKSAVNVDCAWRQYSGARKLRDDIISLNEIYIDKELTDAIKWGRDGIVKTKVVRRENTIEHKDLKLDTYSKELFGI